MSRVTKKVKKPVKAKTSVKETRAMQGDETEEEEPVEAFPEDWEDYYPAGIIDQQIEDKASPVAIEEKREDTRGRLAIIYTVATFLMFVLGFLVAVLEAVTMKTSVVQALTTILPLISGIFLGTLGFVLGYYFRHAEVGGDNNG